MSDIERRIEAATSAISAACASRPRKEGTRQRFERYARAALDASGYEADLQGTVADLTCREQEIKTLCGLLERAYDICGPNDLADEIRTTLDAAGGSRP